MLTGRERNPHDRIVAKLGAELFDQQSMSTGTARVVGSTGARDRNAGRIHREAAQRARRVEVVDARRPAELATTAYVPAGRPAK